MASSSLAAAMEAPTTTPTPLSEMATFFAKLVPYLKATLSFAYNLTKSVLHVSRKLMVPLPIILYIFAPITVFISYLCSVFIFAPYSTLVYLLEALHPLYVFCGVACLTGALLGLVGRYVAVVLTAWIQPSPSVLQHSPVIVKEEKVELEIEA